MGETPDFENLGITHGTCHACHPATLRPEKLDLTHARFLKSIQRTLWNAGQHNDLEAAESTIDDAVNAGIRPVDILMGIIAPNLYQVGEDWKKGTLTVEGEHQFTAFCEKVIDLVDFKFNVSAFANPMAALETLLTSAPGNRHTLAVRILALWLASKGNRTQIVDTQTNLQQLLNLIRTTRIKLLLVSMSLAEQYSGVQEIVERIAKLPMPIRPKVVVGGYAVKLGLVPRIPGADLIADISSLN
jgi:methanogenic corrinoid protein MtbC1